MTDKKKQETKTDNRQPNGWGKLPKGVFPHGS
jgi:hypothetical protein